MRTTYYFIFVSLMVAFVLEFSLGIRMTQVDGLSFKNVSIFVLLLLWVVGNAAKGKPILQGSPVTVPAILFVVYCTLSLIVTGMMNVIPGYSVKQQALYFKSTMDPYLLMLIVFSMTHDAVAARRLLMVLVAVLSVFLAITLLGSFNVIHVDRVYINEKLGRTRGAFAEWNQFALYVVTFMPLVGAFLFGARSRIIKLSLVLILLVSTYVVLLTASRGALVSLAVGGGVYYFLYSKKPVVTKLLALAGAYVVGIIIVIGIALLLPDATSTQLVEKLTGKFEYGGYGHKSDYSSGRLQIWSMSFRYLMEHPLAIVTGTGWKTYAPLFGGNSHNDYLLYLTMTGIIGLFLFVWVFVRLIKAVMAYRKRDPDNLHFFNAYLSSIAAYLTGMMFVNVFNPAYFFFIYSALVLKLGYFHSPETVQDPVPAERETLHGPSRILRPKSSL